MGRRKGLGTRLHSSCPPGQNVDLTTSIANDVTETIFSSVPKVEGSNEQDNCDHTRDNAVDHQLPTYNYNPSGQLNVGTRSDPSSSLYKGSGCKTRPWL